MMKPIAIIPARYASTRFPGKPLVLINGKPMVQHVYERCSNCFDLVVVATDDIRIEEAVKAFGGKVIMTSTDHPSGTDRCAEAARLLAKNHQFDVVVNVQGDEPFVRNEQLESIVHCFDYPETDIATLITPIHSDEILFDPNKVKAVRAVNGNALMFSRQPLPYQRDVLKSTWLDNHRYFLHLGLYAYRFDVLQQITKLEQSPLEVAEKLEQLRWLENGLTIKTAIVTHGNVGIDSPEDLDRL